MLAARANRAGGGRGTRRASEHATKVPLSKKCKLDIKRKHLRGCQGLRGSLHADSYAVNLQLQIDGRNLPEVYKCTIKKHVNNKTSCVSYRLQGTGIYNHLRGLYMRGFAGGEDGVVLLVASTEAAPDLAYEDGSDGEDDGTLAGAALAIARAGVAVADSDSEQQQARQRRPQRPRRQQKKRRRDDTDDEEDDEEAAARLAQEEEDEEEEHGAVGTSGRGRAAAVADARGRGGTYSAQRRSKHQRLQSHPVHLDSLSPGSPGAANNADGGEGDLHARHHAGAAAVPVHMHADLHPHGLAAASGLMPHPHAHMAGGGGAAAAVLGGGSLVQSFAPTLDPLSRGGVDGDVGPAGLEAGIGPFDDVAIGVGLGVGLGGLGSLADGGGLLGGMPVGVVADGGMPGGLLQMGHGAGGSSGGAGPVQVPGATGSVAVADMHPSLVGPGPQHAGIPGMPQAGGDFGGGPHHHHHQQQQHHHQQHHHHHHQQQEPQAPPMMAPPSPQLPPLSLSPFSPRLVQALLGGGPNRGGANQQAHQTVNAYGAPLDFDQGWPGPRQLNYVDPWE